MFNNDDADKYWDSFTEGEFSEYLAAIPDRPSLGSYDEFPIGEPWATSIERRSWMYDSYDDEPDYYEETD